MRLVMHGGPDVDFIMAELGDAAVGILMQTVIAGGVLSFAACVCGVVIDNAKIIYDGEIETVGDAVVVDEI